MTFKCSFGFCVFIALVSGRPDGVSSETIVEDDELAFVANVDNVPGKLISCLICSKIKFDFLFRGSFSP